MNRLEMNTRCVFFADKELRNLDPGWIIRIVDVGALV